VTSAPDGEAPGRKSAEDLPVVIPPVTPDGAVMIPKKKKKKSPTWRIVQIVVSLAIVVGIFVYAIPKFADYSQVWTHIKSMAPFEYLTLLAVTLFNLVTYWWQQMAAMPGLGFWQAAVNNQTSTSIANTIPGGGVLAVGVSYTMYRSWGFTLSQIALSTLVTGIWNIFMKLGLPVVALAILAVQGRASAALVTAALIGVLVLAGAILLFALMLWKKEFARRIGDALGRAYSAIRKLFRKPPATHWGDSAVRFRKQTIKLVARQWAPLTVSTVVSHLALFLVLLLALRHVGVSQQEVSWSQALGVYAFGRLITALPITPGGVGIVELGYIGGLVLAGGPRPEVVAAVLIFRALTYGLQIPLGGFTYLIWKANRSWRKAPPPEPADDVVSPVAGQSSPATG
jgi:uncharacterized protein (TIRG00374 family)